MNVLIIFFVVVVLVCFFIKMIWVEVMLSVRRNSVVNNRMVGNVVNLSVCWVNIVISNIMIDKVILKVNNRLSMNVGSGSIIIDKINRIKIGLVRICYCVDFRFVGRCSIVVRLFMGWFFVNKI